MKTFADDIDRSDGYSGHLQNTVIDKPLDSQPFHDKQASQGGGKSIQPGKYTRFFPYAALFAMICAILVMDAILPLRDLWFHESTLTQLGLWPVEPSLVLFPGWSVIPPIPQTHVTGNPAILPSWGMMALLLGAFVAVFFVFLFPLRPLPAQVSLPFFLSSTLTLGMLFLALSEFT